jgi:hypothetical protein
MSRAALSSASRAAHGLRVDLGLYQGADASLDLHVGEGLGEIVVGPQLEAFGLVLDSSSELRNMMGVSLFFSEARRRRQTS